jgi:AP-2 complex subunit alpha
MTLLGRFIAIRDGNIRYLALESVARLAKLEGPVCIQKHQVCRSVTLMLCTHRDSEQATVLVSLKDADISVRKRALDVLFLMCDNTNGVTIVGELLTYLAAADTAIKEEMASIAPLY